MPRATVALVALAVCAAACGTVSTAADDVVPITEPARIDRPASAVPPSTSESIAPSPTGQPTAPSSATTPTAPTAATTAAPSVTTTAAPSTAATSPTSTAATSSSMTSTTTGTPATTIPEPPGLQTDDPTFDLEPLQPFELAAAGEPDPSVDDAGSVQPTGWAAFDRSLESQLLTNGNTAVSVAVSIGGDVVHEHAFGVRAPFISVDPPRPGDRFRIASISKPITAIVLLELVEEGVVGLDDPVGDLIAAELGVVAGGTRGVTVRRLLNHTSGFGKYDTQFFRKGADDCHDAARIGIRRGASGGGYRYSNMNYCVAGVLIEALTGLRYEEAAYRYALTPLGLSGLRLANTFDPGPGEVLHPSTPGRNYMETLGAAGSWIASPGDLVRIMDSLDPDLPGPKVLEPATLQLMKTPVGGRLGQRGYGLGLISYGPGRYGHTGTIEATHAMVQNRGDGVTWAITVSGPYPDDTPRLESIINRAFVDGGFIAS